MFQELLQKEGWIEQRTISQVGAFTGLYQREYLAVSHRWESPEAPDTQGVQLRSVREYLIKNPGVKWVWYDHWSMPQGQRTAEEQNAFKRMLYHMDLLFMGCSVLALVDISYSSRFWTQVRACRTRRVFACA